MKKAVIAARAVGLAFIAGCVGSILADEGCPPAGGWSFACGPAGVEDPARVPGAHFTEMKE